ncbi:MAG: flagellar hook protein FlgE [Pseudomonadota bacterium]
MSINSALSAGVTGLAAYSTSLAVISDNIANVNTVGYKRGLTDFGTLVTNNDLATQYSAGGVQASSRFLVSQRGLLQQTSSPTDLAISGEGFFVVSQSPSSNPVSEPFLFTRAGQFVQDSGGFLQNAAGLYLQGWPIDAQGNVPVNPSDLTTLEPINVDQLGGTAESTTSMTVNANLQASQAVSPAEATYAVGTSANNMASGNVTPDFQRSVQLFDSLGGFRTLTFSLLKSSTPNEWHAEIHVTPTSDIELGAGLVDGQVAVGTLAFLPNGEIDTTSGATTLPTTLDFLASASGAPGAGQFKWATGLGIDAQSLTLNIGTAGQPGGFTQFDSDSALLSTTVNGAVFGALSGISIDQEGFVTAFYDNGIQRQIYQVPVATFINPDGLNPISGNAFSVTTNSGTFTLQAPNSGDSGSIQSASLEASTVDLAKEFTDLITTQRAYSASTKIITTADQMLEELIRIKQ